MPFTPFHMGPGMALKALAGRHLSLVAFGGAQVAIDIEPLVRMLRDDAVLHGPTHTYAGALGVAVLAFPLLWLSYAGMARVWNGLIDGSMRPAWRMPSRPSVLPVVSGLLLGTFSHVAIDSIMHADMRPGWPFTDTNPTYAAISISALHTGCVAVGVIGIAVFALVRSRTGSRG